MPPIVNKQRPTVGAPKPKASESAWDLASNVRLLIYGQSGSGKTTFCSTFPDPILWLICSGGNRPGELRSIDTPENRKRITPRIVTDTAELRAMIADHEAFRTVVLDHASGLADLTLKEILGLDELPAQKTWGLAQQQQYGQQALKLKEMFRALLNLPRHVAIIAQERTFGGGEEAGGSDILKPTVGAALTPSVTGWLNPACDFVVQAFKRARMERRVNKVGTKEIETWVRGKGVEYCIRTEPHDTYTTKFRLPKGRELPECIVDPDFDKLKQLIDGE